jgi:hypothetical protein
MYAPSRRPRMLALTLVVGLVASVIGLAGGGILSGTGVAAASTNISQGRTPDRYGPRHRLGLLALGIRHLLLALRGLDA